MGAHPTGTKAAVDNLQSELSMAVGCGWWLECEGAYSSLSSAALRVGRSPPRKPLPNSTDLSRRSRCRRRHRRHHLCCDYPNSTTWPPWCATPARRRGPPTGRRPSPSPQETSEDQSQLLEA